MEWATAAYARFVIYLEREGFIMADIQFDYFTAAESAAWEGLQIPYSDSSRPETTGQELVMA